MRFIGKLFSAFTLIMMTGCSCITPTWHSVLDFCWPDPDPDNQGLPAGPEEPVREIHNDEMTALIQSYSLEMRMWAHLYLQNCKTYVDDDSITVIQLQYDTQDLLTVEESRELIVDVTEGLLARLNQNPILASEFYNYPFTSANLEIYITCESYFGKYVDPLYVGWISLEDDEVTYFAFDVLITDRNHWHVRCEQYCTSREVVLYQREAEKRYEEKLKAKPDLFKGARYYTEF